MKNVSIGFSQKPVSPNCFGPADSFFIDQQTGKTSIEKLDVGMEIGKKKQAFF